MRTLLRSSCLGAALLLATILSAPARADTPRYQADRPLAQALQGQAKEAYTSAELLFRSGDYAGAITKYSQAYELSGDPRLLFDMALAFKNMHAYARMQQLLQRYESEGGDAISPKEKATVDRALAAISDLVGSLVLSVNQPGATVAVDGENIATTPLTAPLTVDQGKHTLSVQKPGFDPAERPFEIGGGTSLIITLELSPEVRTGQLVVVAEPGATVIVDQKVVGHDRFDGALPAGAHDVTVTAPGKQAYHAEIDVRVREARTLHVTLQDEKSSGGGSPWPWVVGGTVLVAGAAVGGYFLFRPQDKTTPVPAGTYGGVQLMAWGAHR
jgi:hypothetical protein